MELKLDPKVLESIRDLTDEGEEDFLTTLIHGFYGRFDECYPLMVKAFENGNHSELHEASHKFKGSAANLSALALAEVCQEIEDNCKDKKDANYRELLDQLKKVFELTKEEFDKNWIIKQ